jgi:hypothetical protein
MASVFHVQNGLWSSSAAERRLSARFGRGARDPPARPAYWRGGGSPPVSVAGPATLQQGPYIGGAEALRPFRSRGPRPSSKARILEGRRLSARFGREARDPPARPVYWRGGGSPPISVAGPATLQQGPYIGGAEALRPFRSRGPRPSSKARILEGRRLSARFGSGARDPPARPVYWRGGGSPPVSVAGPATLQQCKKETGIFLRLIAGCWMLDTGCLVFAFP